MSDFGKLLLFPILFVVVFISSVRNLENAANDTCSLSKEVGVYQYKYQSQAPISLTQEGLAGREVVTQNFFRSLTRDHFVGLNSVLLFITLSFFCFEGLKFDGYHEEPLAKIAGFPKYLLFRRILI